MFHIGACAWRMSVNFCHSTQLLMDDTARAIRYNLYALKYLSGPGALNFKEEQKNETDKNE